MVQESVSIIMDEELIEQLEKTCHNIGIDITTAFTMFAQKVSDERCIPFEITDND